MEDVITSPLQQIYQWVGHPLRRQSPNEDACRWKSATTAKCRHDEPASFASLARDGATMRALRLGHGSIASQWTAKAKFEGALARGIAVPVEAVSTEARFYRLADEWSEKTVHISSVSDLINDSRYQQIIGLGWDVLPYLLDDLQKTKRFWFPALAAIAGVRPFDPEDLSSPRRMTDAWLRWGKRKGLID